MKRKVIDGVMFGTLGTIIFLLNSSWGRGSVEAIFHLNPLEYVLAVFAGCVLGLICALTEGKKRGTR